MGAYCSTKAALLQLTRVLDLEEPAVTAVAYAPGVTDTRMMEELRGGGGGALAPELVDRLQSLHQADRLGAPADRASGLAWLALNASSELGGRMINFDDPAIRRYPAKFGGGGVGFLKR